MELNLNELEQHGVVAASGPVRRHLRVEHANGGFVLTIDYDYYSKNLEVCRAWWDQIFARARSAGIGFCEERVQVSTGLQAGFRFYTSGASESPAPSTAAASSTAPLPDTGYDPREAAEAEVFYREMESEWAASAGMSVDLFRESQHRDP